MSNNNTGLSIGQRAYIRKLHGEGSPVRSLAIKYGVTEIVIRDILEASGK